MSLDYVFFFKSHINLDFLKNMTTFILKTSHLSSFHMLPQSSSLIITSSFALSFLQAKKSCSLYCADLFHRVNV